MSCPVLAAPLRAASVAIVVARAAISILADDGGLALQLSLSLTTVLRILEERRWRRRRLEPTFFSLSFSALDLAEIKEKTFFSLSSSLSALDVVKIDK